jgi:hypothetical protein
MRFVQQRPEGLWAHLKGVELRNLCCFDLPHLRAELQGRQGGASKASYRRGMFPRSQPLAYYVRVSKPTSKYHREASPRLGVARHTFYH